MKVSLRFKAPVGTRRKDTVVEIYTGEPVPLDKLKDLWFAELAINALNQTRVHLEVEE